MTSDNVPLFYMRKEYHRPLDGRMTHVENHWLINDNKLKKIIIDKSENENISFLQSVIRGSTFKVNYRLNYKKA